MQKLLIVVGIVVALVAVNIAAQQRQLIDQGAVVVILEERQNPEIDYERRRGMCRFDGQVAVLTNRMQSESVAVTVRVSGENAETTYRVERLPAGGKIDLGCTVPGPTAQTFAYKIVGVAWGCD